VRCVSVWGSWRSCGLNNTSHHAIQTGRSDRSPWRLYRRQSRAT